MPALSGAESEEGLKCTEQNCNHRLQLLTHGPAQWFQFKNKIKDYYLKIKGLPWQSSSYDWVLSMPGPRIRSPIKELRSGQHCGMAKSESVNK